jgi:hypothetical protein
MTAAGQALVDGDGAVRVAAAIHDAHVARAAAVR